MKKRKLLIQPMVFVFLIGTLLTDRSGVGALTMLAAFLHEGGHLLAAKIMQIPLRNLRLDLLGARLDVAGRIVSYSEEWLLCAAGPITSLLCSALVAPFWQLSQFAVIFSCASLLLGLLNLLPITTFDGGRMLESFLLSFTTIENTRRIMKGFTFLFLFLLWASAVYFLLRSNDGLSLLCFSMSLFGRFFEKETSEGSSIK
ncbi:MAG: site-2 protease family protein [Clostridia bacterium]|nr:site-2 protease family protein [Clostridia bacterium]